MTVTEFERIATPRGCLLESPRWSPEFGVLSWVDIPTGRLFQLDPVGDTVSTQETGVTPLGAALPRAGGEFTLVGSAGVRTWHADTARLGQLDLSFDSDAGIISNDAKVDPWGRLYVGRMAADESAGGGSLVAIEPTGEQRSVAAGLTIPNGLAWSPDREWLFFAESIERRVYRIPTGVQGEDWSRREVLIQFESPLPDGLVIGPDGNLWVACYGASRVDRFSLAGEKLGAYSLPVSQVTACEFVGNDLYVTTAAEGFREQDWEREPLAGSLFRLRSAVTGG